MIRRVTANNYLSLVDFEWVPRPETLVLGINGSGKTSALRVIHRLAGFASGELNPKQVMPFERITAWSTEPYAALGLDLQSEDDLFRYEVEFTVDPEHGNTFVTSESLLHNGKPVFARVLNSVALVDSDGNYGQAFPLSRQHSVVSAVEPRSENDPIRMFLQALDRVLVVRPIASTWKEESRESDEFLDPQMGNVVSWYRLQAQNPEFQHALNVFLRELWAGFSHLELRVVGQDAQILDIVFEASQVVGEEIRISFGGLSDGERTLIGLYMLSAYQQTHPGTTLIVDEPDNFVGLPELQPWLLRLLDERPEGGQVILVSHNDRIIDTMGYESAALFTRADHLSPTRVRGIEPDRTGLALSERLSRGWIGE